MTRTPDIARLINTLESAVDQLDHIDAEDFTRANFKAMSQMATRLHAIVKDKRPSYETRGHPPSASREVMQAKGKQAYELRRDSNPPMMWEQIAEALNETRRSPTGQLLIRGWAWRYATKSYPQQPWPVGRRGAAPRNKESEA